MGSNPNPIVIVDDEESHNVDRRSLRPQRAPRRDYSYREIERLFASSADDESHIDPSHKRKRVGGNDQSSLVQFPYKAYLLLN